jgi:carbon-monoxide dehydrogenase large subunit
MTYPGATRDTGSMMKPKRSQPQPFTVLFWALTAVLLCHFLVENLDRLSQVAFVIVDDMEAGLAAPAVYHAPIANYPNGCHICELEIDRETGKVDVVRYNVVDDVGVVINPMLLHGQIQGGIAQGVGQALMEDIHFDSSGQLVTASFQDYAMPHAHDLCNMAVESNPVPTKTNPLGVKGAGEAGCVGALPAAVNALVDALSEFGVKHIEMPATPERIWRAMQGS